MKNRLNDSCLLQLAKLWPSPVHYHPRRKCEREQERRKYVKSDGDGSTMIAFQEKIVCRAKCPMINLVSTNVAVIQVSCVEQTFSA